MPKTTWRSHGTFSLANHKRLGQAIVRDLKAVSALERLLGRRFSTRNALHRIRISDRFAAIQSRLDDFVCGDVPHSEPENPTLIYYRASEPADPLLAVFESAACRTVGPRHTSDTLNAPERRAAIALLDRMERDWAGQVRDLVPLHYGSENGRLAKHMRRFDAAVQRFRVLLETAA